MNRTQHTLSTGRPVEFVGAKLFAITAISDDGQTASATLAADDEWKARTQLMAIQTTMSLMGQTVEYDVQEVAATREP